MRKTCFKCHKSKPLDDYYEHPMMADGHLNKCKECAKRDVRLHRRENESVREYDRRRSRAGKRKAHLAENSRRWARENPEKRAAQRAVNNAVRDGRLHKPDSCSRCKEKTPSRSLHGHHEDYSRPLDVKWLCARCHARHLRRPV